MPELQVGAQRWLVEPGANLLDALNGGGCQVPSSCRAGSCHACLVRCLSGQAEDRAPEALPAERRAEGWRLACQCRVVEDLTVAPFDPRREGIAAEVVAVDWPSASVLRLRLQPQRPLRYQAGQHLLLWTLSGIARPYSLASLPQDDPWLEFHLDCARSGAFCDQARELRPGATLRLGELHGGALHYSPDWSTQPLLLLAAGTGLAPLWGLLREALRQHHEAPIRLVHLASEHYLADALHALAETTPSLSVELLTPDRMAELSASLRRLPRRTRALLCGSPERVEAFARALYLAGVPRSQVLADLFVPPAH
jgi:NAD(P)H-flavin reductase